MGSTTMAQTWSPLRRMASESSAATSSARSAAGCPGLRSPGEPTATVRSSSGRYVEWNSSMPPRLTVPERRHPQRRNPIQVTVAVDVVQPRALGPVDDGRFVARPQAVLGERVPHRRGVALEPVHIGLRVVLAGRLVGYDHV